MPAGRRAALLAIAALLGVAGCAVDGSGESSAARPPASSTPSSSNSGSTTVPGTAPRPVTPPSTVAAPAAAAVTQPAQPSSGPGGSQQPHQDWRVSSGGAGADAWYVAEPADPRPASAPVAIVLHGYYEFAGYDSMHEFIRHTARTGTIVIYPRWQTGVAQPCPGPFAIEPCVAAAVNGIRGALEHLGSDPGRVRPELGRTSYFGFSFGGIIAANLANRHAELGLPVPRVIFLDDPHDGGLNGAGEPSLDASMAGIPSSVLVQCHVGAQGVISEAGKAGSSCNAWFPMLGHIPAENKRLVLTRPDDHGTPALSSGHGVCAAGPGRADAYDWNFCWATWDALRSAAVNGPGGAIGGGEVPEPRGNGAWSDGTPVVAVEISGSAPIRP